MVRLLVVNSVEPDDCIHEMQTLSLTTMDDNSNTRLVCFKGGWNIVKYLKMFVKDLKASAVPLGEEFVKFVKDSYQAWQVLVIGRK